MQRSFGQGLGWVLCQKSELAEWSVETIFFHRKCSFEQGSIDTDQDLHRCINRKRLFGLLACTSLNTCAWSWCA